MKLLSGIFPLPGTGAFDIHTDMFDSGFDIVGNATIVVYDKRPLLVTDPWLAGGAYFGSWCLSHQIPAEQLEAIGQAEYFWISHGHPDHLHLDSLEKHKEKTILLPDHVGQRIYKDLQAAGYKIKILKDRNWVRLSDRVKVMCIADYNQDALLMMEINGRLLVNLNDSGALGHQGFVRKVIASYENSILTMLTGHGDADMINYFSEDGRRIPPLAGKKFPVGKAISEKVDGFGAKIFIPSSSTHKYQREDSIWANEFTTKLHDYADGFQSEHSKILPAFVRYNCVDDSYSCLNPLENPVEPISPAQFGDDWNELLDAEDVSSALSYFRSVQHIKDNLDFINLRVGGKDNILEMRSKNFKQGITFEVPRASLKTAIQYEIFDDLLIGNFMKTTLHGLWPKSKLYPDFTPYLAKYSDNGRAKTKEELREYFEAYRGRAPLDYLMHRFEEKSKNIIRKNISPESVIFQKLKRTYWQIKGLTQ